MSDFNRDVSRRDFMRAIGLASGATIIPLTSLFGNSASSPSPAVDIEFYKDETVRNAEKKLNILVLGGTGFIGPPLVQYAIERGHTITLLNRGITNPHLFKRLKRIKADRLIGLNSVIDRIDQPWDVVIDTWQGNPLAVQEAAAVLAPHAKQYIYVSSIAVYGRKNYDTNSEIFEDLALPEVDPMPSSLTATVNDYRTRKQLAELSVIKSFGDQSSITRFHNIVGFYMEPGSEGQIYWPVRFQRGGNILLPGEGKDNMQTIDVKDAARWLITSAENKTTGIYNAGRRYSWGEYAGACRSLSEKECRLFWVPLEHLREQKIEVNSDMPYYIPRIWGPGFFNISDKKAINNGITYRPLAATLTDITKGFNAHYDAEYEFGKPNCDAGISRERERDALKNLKLV